MKPRLSLAASDPAIAVAAGAVFSLACTYTSLWWLALLCLAALAWRVGAATPRRAAGLGGLFGAAWGAAGTWWLYISMHRYGGLAAPLAALAVLALSAALSTYLAAAMALQARLRRGPPWRDAACFAALWGAAELARGLLFTGFPWAATGYGQIDGPLAALAPWVGVYGIGFVAALVAALVASARRGPVVAGLAVVALAPFAARNFTAPSGSLSVTLLQTDVAQDEKFAEDRMPEALDWLAEALAQAHGRLVVAPETAIPLLPDQLGEAAWQRYTAPFASGDRAALVGLPLGSFEAGYTNSVAGLSAETLAAPGGYYRYDKHHLVPFGEFVPFGFRWFVDLMSIPLGDFSRGALVQPSFPVQGERIAPNICYEDLFGEELARRFADEPQAPTIMANVSNIGWFGDTIAVAQHLNISRMRALEFQRPMLRATNTGATVVIDHTGRVTASLPPFTRGALDATVEGRTGLTPYARWASQFGAWPLVLFALVVVLGSTVAGRRAERR